MWYVNPKIMNPEIMGEVNGIFTYGLGDIQYRKDIINNILYKIN